MKSPADRSSNYVVRKTIAAVLVGICGLALADHGSAANLYWETTSGTWSTASTTPKYWATTSGGTPTNDWTNGSSAIVEATSATMTIGTAGMSMVNFTINNGAIWKSASNASFSGTVTGAGSGALTLSGSTGSGQRLDLSLAAGATWNGTVTLNTNLGIVNSNSGNRLILALNSGGTGLSVANNGGSIIMTESATIGSLSGNTATAWINGAAGATNATKVLTVAQSVNTTYAGVLMDDSGTGVGQRVLSLVKTNSGRLRLTGTNTSVGTTTISGGSLYVDGISAGPTGQGAYSVGSGATLGGTGSIGLSGTNAVTVANGGILDPGDISDAGVASTGTLLIGGATSGAGLTFSGTASIQFALGTTKDMITLTGSTMSGSANGGAGSITFDFNNTGAATTTTYDLISFGGTTQGIALNTFALSAASISAGWSGTFVYGGDGNTLQFAVTSIPEPGTVFLCGLGLGSLLLLRRRSRS